MSELSKIRKDGVDYDIKDPVAREEMEALKESSIRYTEQNLTSEQKTQARRNIGAAADRKNSFVEEGGASLAIYNVSVVGTRKRIYITDIRNNLVFSGCWVHYGDPELPYASNYNMRAAQIVFDGLIGHIRVELDGATLSFDYDISGIEEGTKLTATLGNTTLVSPDCYYPAGLPYTSLAMFEKIGIIGDSLASGEIYLSNGDGTYTGKTCYNLSWGQVLARKNGVRVTNFSKGGLDTRDWLTHEKGLPLMQSEEAQNLYILALGVNDVGIGSDYLGTVADITDNYVNNPDTFYGNYARIIEQIMEHAPNAKMIISTTAQATAVHNNFNTAIKNIAKHYGFPYIEQYRDDFFLSSYYRKNQVQYHPTAPLYAGMAMALERLIIQCIVNNPDYFENYVG